MVRMTDPRRSWSAGRNAEPPWRSAAQPCLPGAWRSCPHFIGSTLFLEFPGLRSGNRERAEAHAEATELRQRIRGVETLGSFRSRAASCTAYGLLRGTAACSGFLDGRGAGDGALASALESCTKQLALTKLLASLLLLLYASLNVLLPPARMAWSVKDGVCIPAWRTGHLAISCHWALHGGGSKRQPHSLLLLALLLLRLLLDPLLPGSCFLGLELGLLRKPGRKVYWRYGVRWGGGDGLRAHISATAAMASWPSTAADPDPPPPPCAPF